MAHKAKSETVIQALERIYRMKNDTGAVTKILKRITKKLFNVVISARDLTDTQRLQVEAYALDEVMAKDKVEFFSDEAIEPKSVDIEPITPTTADETTLTPTQSYSIELQEQIMPVTPVKLEQVSRLEMDKTKDIERLVNRVKTERVIYFPDIKDRANRKFLSLEKPFVDALDVLAPTNDLRNEWLNTVLAGEPDHAAAIVRNTIVSTLLTKWVQP